MSRSLLIGLLALILALPTAAGAQDLEPGSVAVMPFGAAAWDQNTTQSALLISNVVQEQLENSGRFEAVLPRSPAVEAAIQRLVDEAQGPQNFDSYIQISAEKGLNANYLLDGFIESLEVKAERGSQGRYYDANIHVRLRVFDVETRRLMLSQRLEVTNNAIGGGDRDCGGLFGGIKCKAEETLKFDSTPEAALQRALDNAGDAVRGFIQREMSLILVDWEVGDDGMVSELVIKSAPDLAKGMSLDVAVRKANRRGNETRDRSRGSARIVEIDDGWAYAEVTDGHDDIDEILNDGSLVVVKPVASDG